MTDELNQQIARSLEVTPELLPFLPELLADVWALGSSASIIVELLGGAGIAGPKGRVLDIGCGKGAAAISLAKELGCRVRGIDAFEPFIAEARDRARDAGVAALCAFECADMHEVVAFARDFDAVVYAALGPRLAGRPCVEVLRQCVRPGGFIVIDDGYLVDGVKSKPPGYDDLMTHGNTVKSLTAQGDRVLREVTQSPDMWHADDGRVLDSIRRRAQAIADRHPDAADLLWEYVRRQERECQTLRAIHVPATWLLECE